MKGIAAAVATAKMASAKNNAFLLRRCAYVMGARCASIAQLRRASSFAHGFASVVGMAVVTWRSFRELRARRVLLALAAIALIARISLTDAPVNDARRDASSANFQHRKKTKHAIGRHWNVCLAVR